MGHEEDELEFTVGGGVASRDTDALPDVLDVVIVGAGPGGTAAALRAKELDLSALVIEADDLFRAIRDFPVGKKVEPDYRGGNDLPFPANGDLLRRLHFEVTVREHALRAWRRLYLDPGLRAKVGSEFIGLERVGDLWRVLTWNQRLATDVGYTARNVIIAIGKGGASLGDIPGNTDGIALRLDDPQRFVGSPVAIIGGGTSAAEAVIDISKAKVRRQDTTSVYWSYRKESMPKVAKNLSADFFDAYVVNGNIRYLPNSEIAAVVSGPERSELVSIRVDRKEIVGRPIETVHFEFPKDRVIACIGGQEPYDLLAKLGVRLAGTAGSPMMLVTEDGETSLDGVFLVGDARGGTHVVCSAFDDPSTYQRRRSPRNIKAAMWDGVQALECIAQRLGKSFVQNTKTTMAAPVHIPKVETSPPEPVAPGLARIRADGSIEAEYPMTSSRVTIGRDGTDVACPFDTAMASPHAILTRRGDEFMLEDSGSSRSGVWIRLRASAPYRIATGDWVAVGKQLLRPVEREGAWWLEHYREGRRHREWPITDTGIKLGKAEQPGQYDGDSTLSRRHALFRLADGAPVVADLASTNGTYVRLREPTVLSEGDEFQIGATRFRFGEPLAQSLVDDIPKTSSVGGSAKPAPAGSIGGAVIEDARHPISFATSPDKNLLECLLDHFDQAHPDSSPESFRQQPLNWECLSGSCGYCVVEIQEGAENFATPADTKELNTIETVCGKERNGNRFRLACRARVTGPVKLTVP